MFSNDKNIETIGQLAEVLKHYVGLQSEYVRLDVVEKVVRLVTALVVAGVILLLLVIAMIYFSFATALALEPEVGSVAAYSIVGAFYILLLILVVSFRHKWIERPLVKFLASLLMK